MDGGRKRHLQGRSNECMSGEIIDAGEDETIIFEHGFVVFDLRPR